MNLRQKLLSSIRGFNAENDAATIAAAKSRIQHHIPDFFVSSKPVHNAQADAGNLDKQCGSIGRMASSALARWLRQSVILRLEIRRETISRPKESKDGNDILSDLINSTMNVENFDRLQLILVGLKEFSILADIMNMIIDRVASPTLIAIANTTNYYFDIFSAIGAANVLFQELYQRVKNGSGQYMENAFIETLTDLCSRLQGTHEQLEELQKVSSLHASRQPPTAAYSPISDTMLETVPSTEATFMDEMDQLLASGTSMDKQTLTRIFRSITSHLTKLIDASDSQMVRYSQVLASLRAFDPATFDILLGEWLQKWLQGASRGHLSTIISPLICQKVISLETALFAVAQFIGGDCRISTKADVLLDTADILVDAASETMSDIDASNYIMHHHLQQMIRQSPECVLAILKALLRISLFEELSIQRRAKDCIRSQGIQNLVQSVILQLVQETVDKRDLDQECGFDAETACALGEILLEGQFDGNFIMSPLDRTLRILRGVSDFNAHFSCLEIKATWLSEARTSRENTETLSDFIIHEAGSSSPDRIELWQYLILDLPQCFRNAIEEKAESKTLDLLNDAIHKSSGVETPLITNFLLVLEACAPSTRITQTSPFLEKIGVMLNDTVSPKLHIHNERDNIDRPLQIIRTLLRLLVIHQNSLRDPKYSQQHLYQLLITLSSLLVHPRLVANSTLLDYILDILCLLTDGLSSETRIRCMRSLHEQFRFRDTRLVFLFGQPENLEDEWLQLTTKSAQRGYGRNGESAPHIPPKPYVLRPFEMMQDATPVAAENDTTLSLTFFGTKKSIL